MSQSGEGMGRRDMQVALTSRDCFQVALVAFVPAQVVAAPKSLFDQVAKQQEIEQPTRLMLCLVRIHSALVNTATAIGNQAARGSGKSTVDLQIGQIELVRRMKTLNRLVQKCRKPRIRKTARLAFLGAPAGWF